MGGGAFGLSFLREGGGGGGSFFQLFRECAARIRGGGKAAVKWGAGGGRGGIDPGLFRGRGGGGGLGGLKRP